MADLTIAFFYVMKNEDFALSGAVTQEPGGAKARFGVNSKAHPQALIDGFYEMGKSEALQYAKNIFRDDYWLPIRGPHINNQYIGNKVVDFAFNMGVTPAVKVLQRALNDYLGRVVLVVDGVIGTHTLQNLNSANQTEILAGLRKWGVKHYEAIIAEHPEDEKYRRGWIARAEK